MGLATLEAYRKQLVEMRDRLIQAVDSSEHTLRANRAADGDSMLPTHPADQAIEGLDEENAIVAAEERLLDQVQGALERIQAGTFGNCEECGSPIAAERLKAVPYSARCMACATRLEEGR